MKTHAPSKSGQRARTSMYMCARKIECLNSEELKSKSSNNIGKSSRLSVEPWSLQVREDVAAILIALKICCMWRIVVLYHISSRRRDKSLGFLISRKIHRKNGRVWLDKRKHMRRMDNRRWNGAQICSGWKTHGRPIGSHVQNALLQRHFGIDDFSGSLAVVRAVGFMRYIYLRVIRPVDFMRYEYGSGIRPVSLMR